jgi:flagellar L-ring protein precursor FlgH
MLALVGALAGCSAPSPLVQGPVSVRPIAPPSYVEKTVTGGIYRANLGNVSLFSDQRKPQNIGDTIKIDIAENLSASNTVNSVNSRDNVVSSKGPGMNSDSLGTLLKGLANMNATASGSDAFTGKGNSQNTAQFNARLAAYVINVLSNGNLVVAGERSMSFNGGVNTLRFSGVVNPLDIKAGGIVASGDVVDAKTELVGSGGTADTASRTWLQKLLTDGLSVW